MKLHWNHVEWGKSPRLGGYSYYFYWFVWMGWEKIPEIPMVGIYKTWYDGPHVVFRFGPIALSWSTQWTTYDRNKWDK